MKVYTITVNPSLDYVVSLDLLHLGEVNRAQEAKLFAGGKGINVSQVLTQLDVDNCALGFIGGSTGQELLQQLNQKKIKSDFTTIIEKKLELTLKLRLIRKQNLMPVVLKLVCKNNILLRQN